MNIHTELWAKKSGCETPYPLFAHLLDAATVGGVLYKHWLRAGLQNLVEQQLGAHTEQIVRFVIGAHDIGKACPLFQLRYAEKGDDWAQIRETVSATGFYAEIEKGSELRDATLSCSRRHEQWSAYAVKRHLLEGTDKVGDYWSELIALGHHGKFGIEHSGNKGKARRYAAEDLEASGWSKAQQDLRQALLEACGLAVADIPSHVSSTVTILLSGLTVLADRIASGDEFVTAGAKLIHSAPEILEDGAEWITRRSEEALQRVANTVGIYRPWENAEKARESILGHYTLRPIQEEALNIGDGLWSLMAETGGGKTEAALLRHAARPERLLFLLPTQATSNAMMKRIRRVYEGTPNVAALAHGNAAAEDFYSIATAEELYTHPLSIFDEEKTGADTDGHTPDEPTGLYPSSFVRAGAARLFAPVCVGTVDQLLAAGLKGKWLHWRLLALANAHVVIDEVHTLDQYQTVLLEAVLPWLAATGTRVTFLTATMPGWQRDKLIRAYAHYDAHHDTHRAPALPFIRFPASEHVHAGKLSVTPIPAASKTIHIDMRETAPDNIETAHINWHREARTKYPQARIGIVCNTVRRAQNIAEHFINRGEHTIVLHARMTAEHRRRESERLLKHLGPNGDATDVTVVGTQALEASLDIDLDLLNTELCPAPSLIQRAGRQWRHEDPRRNRRIPQISNKRLTVHWFKDDQGYASKPYFVAELDAVREFLDRHPELKLPEDAQEFIDAAAIDFDTATDDKKMAMLLAESVKRNKADSVRANIRQAIAKEAKFTDYEDLTGCDLLEDAATRIMDSGKQYRLILGGDPEHVPGAWDGSVKDLRKIRAGDLPGIRRALRASMPIRVTDRDDERFQDETCTLDGSPSMLRGYRFLPQAERFYSSTIGFTGLTPGEDGTGNIGNV